MSNINDLDFEFGDFDEERVVVWGQDATGQKNLLAVRYRKNEPKADIFIFKGECLRDKHFLALY